MRALAVSLAGERRAAANANTRRGRRFFRRERMSEQPETDPGTNHETSEKPKYQGPSTRHKPFERPAQASSESTTDKETPSC